MPTIHPTGQPYPLNAIIDFGPLPRGDRGAEATVQIIRAIIHSTDRTGWIRDLAQSIIMDAGPRYDDDARRFHIPASVAALFRWTQTRFVYADDPPNAEATAHPDQLLAHYATTGQRIPGDCDDRAAFLASMTRAAGYPSILIIAGRDPAGRYEHIYPGIIYADRIVPLDSQECRDPGQERPAAKRKVYAI